MRLSAELARWFDDELWQHEGRSEYREPIPPSDLIETFPEAIWPGLMPPDFLPVLGNMAGDWLCMRIEPMGEVAEIVQWYHGGGDWPRHLGHGRNLGRRPRPVTASRRPPRTLEPGGRVVLQAVARRPVEREVQQPAKHLQHPVCRARLRRTRC